MDATIHHLHSADIIPFPAARAVRRVWTPAERAAMALEHGQRVRVRRSGGLITIEGRVECTTCTGDGRGRVGIRVTRGPSLGALTSVCALEVEVLS